MNEATQTEIRELQKTELNITKEFTAICDRHGLMYYMMGGTMLGAVRHKGFIPWDDDMDLGMPRDDYERLMKIAPKELPDNLKLVTYKNTPEYQYFFSRIIDEETKVIEEKIGNNNRLTNACIDIFPLDGTPNIGLFREIYFFRVLFHRALLSMCYKDSIDRKRKRAVPEQILLQVLEKIPIEKFTTPYNEKCIIDNLLKKHSVKGSKFIGNIMGAYRTKEIVPTKFYGKGKFYQFEDTQLRGPSMYDEYLTYTYGNYMQLPSKKDRERKSHYKIIELHGKKIEE